MGGSEVHSHVDRATDGLSPRFSSLTSALCVLIVMAWCIHVGRLSLDIRGAEPFSMFAVAFGTALLAGAPVAVLLGRGVRHGGAVRLAAGLACVALIVSVGAFELHLPTKVRLHLAGDEMRRTADHVIVQGQAHGFDLHGWEPDPVDSIGGLPVSRRPFLVACSSDGRFLPHDISDAGVVFLLDDSVPYPDGLLYCPNEIPPNTPRYTAKQLSGPWYLSTAE